MVIMNLKLSDELRAALDSTTDKLLRSATCSVPSSWITRSSIARLAMSIGLAAIEEHTTESTINLIKQLGVRRGRPNGTP